jgi:hypothetical protein
MPQTLVYITDDESKLIEYYKERHSLKSKSDVIKKILDDYFKSHPLPKQSP